ncbi:adenosylcobinamide-GDP ribazoletransferase [Afifella sp. IM 167]|uniref:adenosylcobinamide-GDP ribazoletransferase n=1 Tax=Afifella sp. IM 167 TaxID=2033586 RepID=UPI001CCDAAF3
MSDLAENFRRLPVDTRACLAFFSRLPIAAPLVEPGTQGRGLAASAAAWPLAGALIALTPAVILSLMLAFGASPLLAAIVSLAALAGITGGLHEDGLADTADGFGGGTSNAARLEIMRDSRIGSYGVLALIFVIAIRIAGLAEVSLSPATAGFTLISVAALARAGALFHWSALGHARADGIARWAGRPDSAGLAFAGVLAAPAGLILLVLFGFSAIFAVILAGLGVYLFTRLARRLIGGHTGDTIGASVLIAEALLFAGLAL